MHIHPSLYNMSVPYISCMYYVPMYVLIKYPPRKGIYSTTYSSYIPAIGCCRENDE